MRIGYVPLSPMLSSPGDRRRFPAYADERGLDLAVVDRWDGLDVVVLTSEVDLVMWSRAPRDVRIVLDLPDAFLEEQRGFRTRARGLAKWIAGPLSRPVASHRNEMIRLIRRADAVVCSTPEQSRNLTEFTGNVHDVLDLHREFVAIPPAVDRGGDRLELVWEGLFPTLSAVTQVLPALRELAKTRELCLHLVTDRWAPRFMNRFFAVDVARLVRNWGVPVDLHPWSRDTLAGLARRSDLAIVPVDQDDPYAMGKPENRMRLFWRLGLPVVGSDTPAHRRACAEADLPDDLLCSSAGEWEDAVRQYGLDAKARRRVAEAGQAAALGPYGDEAITARWDGVLSSLDRT